MSFLAVVITSFVFHYTEMSEQDILAVREENKAAMVLRGRLEDENGREEIIL